MSETKPTETKVPLNAPKFMRPQKPVLDDPLDIDQGQNPITPQGVETSKLEPSVNDAVDPVVPVTDVGSEVETEVEPILEAETVGIGAADPTGEDVIPAPELTNDISSDETADTLDPVSDPEPVGELQPKPDRARQMTPFQRFIVVLLILLVVLLLVTVYLFVTDRIEIPPVVIATLESWLDFLN